MDLKALAAQLTTEQMYELLAHKMLERQVGHIKNQLAGEPLSPTREARLIAMKGSPDLLTEAVERVIVCIGIDDCVKAFVALHVGEYVSK